MKKIITLVLVALFLAACQLPFGGNQTDNSSVLLDLGAADDNGTTDDVVIDEDSTETTEDTGDMDDTSTSSNLPSKTFKEGDLIQFKTDLAYDPDGDSLSYSFSEPLDANGKWQTEIGDAGEYVVNVKVSDGKLESTQQVLLIVEAVNALPVISNFDDVEVDEGEKIEFEPTVTDEDGDSITLSYSGFMEDSSYKTDYDDAGEYKVTLSANDGKQTATKTVNVVVNNVNRAPIIGDLEDIEVMEGETVELEVEAADPDGDALSIEIGQPLQEGTWETEKGDAGTYEVDITASDGDLETTKTIKVVVKALNSLPELDVPESITVDEGELIEINPEVSDADGDSLEITYSGFMESSSYQTDYDDAGEYEVTVTVDDGKETVSETIDVVIVDQNRPPVFNDDLFN